MKPVWEIINTYTLERWQAASVVRVAIRRRRGVGRRESLQGVVPTLTKKPGGKVSSRQEPQKLLKKINRVSWFDKCNRKFDDSGDDVINIFLFSSIVEIWLRRLYCVYIALKSKFNSSLRLYIQVLVRFWITPSLFLYLRHEYNSKLWADLW